VIELAQAKEMSVKRFKEAWGRGTTVVRGNLRRSRRYPRIQKQGKTISSDSGASQLRTVSA